MRVIHVVPSINEETGGPSYSVLRLCESLLEAGTDARVAALDWLPSDKPHPRLNRFPLGFGPRRLGVSPGMERWLESNAASGECDVIHNHGLWMMPNIYPGRTCRRHEHCRLVVSPRGTLSRWALSFHSLRKRIFWSLLQGPAVREAACFHATADSEYEDIRALGFTQPVCVIPNGIDLPLLKRTPSKDRRRLLFLGRIHPKKGVDVLLRAWRAVEGRFPDWDLQIAGPDNGGYQARMTSLAAELRLHRVIFSGPLYGANKLHAYRRASLFVLPTHSENFGLTVAESMAAGTPVIVTVGAPWSRLASEGAGWWIDIGVDPLVACLETALATPPEQLERMGGAAHEWMARDYQWPRIGAQCAATYRWLREGGPTPPWVRLN